MHEQQMKTIGELQEKIKLLKFDITKNIQTIASLKESLKQKRKSMAKVKEELIMMKESNDYTKIDNLIRNIKD